MVRTLLNIQLLFYGMTYLMILEKLPILTNLKTFYYLGMEMNANVMHVKKINIIHRYSGIGSPLFSWKTNSPFFSFFLVFLWLTCAISSEKAHYFISSEKSHYFFQFTSYKSKLRTSIGKCADLKPIKYFKKPTTYVCSRLSSLFTWMTSESCLWYQHSTFFKDSRNKI